MSQISTIRTYEVAGSFSITLQYHKISLMHHRLQCIGVIHLMNRVVVTSSIDKFTVTAASK